MTDSDNINTAQKMLHKSSGMSHAQFMPTRVPTNKACWYWCLVNS